MPDYFMGSEDVDFPTSLRTGSPGFNTGSGFDSNYSRCAVTCSDVNYVSLALDALTTAPVAGDTFDVAARAVMPVNQTGSLIVARQSGVAQRLWDLRNTVTTGAAVLRVWNGASYTSIALSHTFVNSETYRICVRTYLHASAGYVRVYIDGTEVGEFTGNTLAVAGLTTIDRVDLRGSEDGSSAQAINWSEIIASSRDLRYARLKTLVPNAAGSVSDWTGAYTDIDEATLSTADMLTSATNGQRELWGVTDFATLLTSANLEVAAVALHAQARRGATGVSQMELVTKISGTTYAQTKALSESYETIRHVWDSGTVPFPSADVNAMEQGVGALT